MVITFGVKGFFDWEPAELHPGVQITQKDVDQKRAKKLADGRWAIRVEKTQPSHHDTCITEVQLCDYIAGRTAVGAELSRQDAVMYLLGQSAQHHVARRHVCEVTVGGKTHKAVEVSDSGPVPELLKSCLEARSVTGPEAEAALARYLEPCDLVAAITMQHAAAVKKGA
jgi:hypothetical protein